MRSSLIDTTVEIDGMQKVQLELVVEMKIWKSNTVENRSFFTTPFLLDSSDISSKVDSAINNLLNQLEIIKTKGSDWHYTGVVCLKVITVDVLVRNFIGHDNNFLLPQRIKNT